MVLEVALGLLTGLGLLAALVLEAALGMLTGLGMAGRHGWLPPWAWLAAMAAWVWLTGLGLLAALVLEAALGLLTGLGMAGRHGHYGLDDRPGSAGGHGW